MPPSSTPDAPPARPHVDPTAASLALIVPGVALTLVGRVALVVALVSAFVIALRPETSLGLIQAPAGPLAALAAVALGLGLAAWKAPPAARPGLRRALAATLAAGLVLAFALVILRPVVVVYDVLLGVEDAAAALGPLGRPGLLLLGAGLALGLGHALRWLGTRWDLRASPCEEDVRCYEHTLAMALMAALLLLTLAPAVQKFCKEVGASTPLLFELAMAATDIVFTYGKWLLAERPSAWVVLPTVAAVAAIPLALGRRHPSLRVLGTTWRVAATVPACALGLGVGAAFAELASRL